MTRRSRVSVLRVAWLPTVGLVVAGMMARTFYLVDPYDPGRTMVSAQVVMHGSGVLALHLLWVTVVMQTFAVRSIGDASARRRAATGRR